MGCARHFLAWREHTMCIARMPLQWQASIPLTCSPRKHLPFPWNIYILNYNNVTIVTYQQNRSLLEWSEHDGERCGLDVGYPLQEGQAVNGTVGVVHGGNGEMGAGKTACFGLAAQER